MVERISQLLDKKEIGLTQRERQAIKQRLEGHSMEKAGKMMGITHERIRQLENTATGKIRKYFSQ